MLTLPAADRCPVPETCHNAAQARDALAEYGTWRNAQLPGPSSDEDSQLDIGRILASQRHPAPEVPTRPRAALQLAPLPPVAVHANGKPIAAGRPVASASRPRVTLPAVADQLMRGDVVGAVVDGLADHAALTAIAARCERLAAVARACDRGSTAQLWADEAIGLRQYAAAREVALFPHLCGPWLEQWRAAWTPPKSSSRTTLAARPVTPRTQPHKESR